MSDSGLLPAIGDDELAWLRPRLPAGADREEVLAAEMDFEYARSDVLSVVWPARVDGNLRPPPDAHVLDSLVRAYIIVDCAGQTDVENEAARHPNGCTVIVTPRLPECDACARVGATTHARYDAAQRGRVFWASLCPAHYDRYGTGRLGIGLGQYLITPDEVSADVREAFMRARAYWAARGVSLPEWLPWDG